MDETPQEQLRSEHKSATPIATRQRSRSALVFALFVGLPALLFWSVTGFGLLAVLALFGSEAEYCTVARVPVHGVITTTGEGAASILGAGAFTLADDFVQQIQTAEEDPYIEAIVLDIDSPGGTPVAADEMLTALLATEKPVVAVVRELGASAGYWVASGADYLIASPVSQVGSIGVTMSYLETASSSDMEGARWVDISSGLFKDAGHPERVLREEEQTFLQSQVTRVHEYMTKRISEARPALSMEELVALSDGRAYTGIEAQSLKLVDALGGFQEAKVWLQERLGLESDAVVLCEPPKQDLLEML